MLTDPQSVTLAGTAVSLPRTAITATGAAYTAPDSTLVLDTIHNYGRRNRSMVRIRQDKIAADPLVATTNRRLSASAWVTIDTPPEGFSVAEQVALVKALSDWLSASTYANTTKLVGGES
jgi:hypothetical protein